MDSPRTAAPNTPRRPNQNLPRHPSSGSGDPILFFSLIAEAAYESQQPLTAGRLLYLLSISLISCICHHFSSIYCILSITPLAYSLSGASQKQRLQRHYRRRVSHSSALCDSQTAPGRQKKNLQRRAAASIPAVSETYQPLSRINLRRAAKAEYNERPVRLNYTLLSSTLLLHR